MSDLLELTPLRDWQAKAVPPFAVPEYEDFASMVQWMERVRDELEALSARIAQLEAERDAARESALEEAAKVAESTNSCAHTNWSHGAAIASAIRALKDTRHD